jgi:voltage-gated potassium channel
MALPSISLPSDQTIGRLDWFFEAPVILAAIATVPLTIVQVRGDDSRWIVALDWTIWLIFAVDLFIASVHWRWQTFRKEWLSIAVVVLSFPGFSPLLAFTRLVRLSRLMRLLRLARLVFVASRGLRAIREILFQHGLIYLICANVILIIVGGGLLSIIEPQTVKGGFAGGIWWAIVTASTVGYGDIAPSTLAGRVVAIILMLTGIGLLSTVSASIAAYFVGQHESSDLAAMTERLDRIERLLEQVSQVRTEEQRPR